MPCVENRFNRATASAPAACSHRHLSRGVQALAVTLLSLGLQACSVLGGFDAPASAPMAPAPVATPGTSAPLPAAAGSGKAGAAAKSVAPSAPVDPAVQQAFDQARREMGAGRTEQAERAFRALAAAHPDLAGPHANLGVLARQAGHLDQSIAELEEAVRLNPTVPATYNELAISYRQQGQFEKARAAYEQALALDPQNAPAALNLGILYDLYLGDDAKALAQYQRYLALSPGGDATATKWVAEIEHRKPSKTATADAADKATAAKGQP